MHLNSPPKRAYSVFFDSLVLLFLWLLHQLSPHITEVFFSAQNCVNNNNNRQQYLILWFLFQYLSFRYTFSRFLVIEFLKITFLILELPVAINKPTIGSFVCFVARLSLLIHLNTVRIVRLRVLSLSLKDPQCILSSLIYLYTYIPSKYMILQIMSFRNDLGQPIECNAISNKLLFNEMFEI